MGGQKKAWLELAGAPVLMHALRPFLKDSRVVSVAVALAPEDAADPPAWLAALDPRIVVVPGGSSRTASVAAAVAALPLDVDVLLVHDAARPLVDSPSIDRCIRTAASGVGAVVGIPAVDTLKRVEAGDARRIVETPDRGAFWHAQTPQGFPADLLRAALARTELHDSATDDASLVEADGGTVVMVQGHSRNLKVTRPEDLPVAELHLRELIEAVAAGGDG